MTDSPQTVSERRRQEDRRTPVVFLSLGTSLALTDNDYETALRRLGAQLGRPRAVVALSSDWQATRPIRVTSSRNPETLGDDQSGSRPAAIRPYHCPGSPSVAAEVASHLRSAGLPMQEDPQHGLGFGVWMPLSMMYPRPTVPVVQVSQPIFSSPEEIVAIGQALAPLRRTGVLLVGSGGIVCSPSYDATARLRTAPDAWAVAFDAWARDRLEAFDLDALVNYRRSAPQAYIAAPTSRYLDALFFVLGTRLPGDRITQVHEGFHAGNVSLRSCLLLGRRKEDGQV